MYRTGILTCAFVLVCVLVSGATAAAQIRPQPVPVFAADLRAALPRFKADPLIASTLAVRAQDLPTLGLGLVAGAHLYPLRTRTVTLGVGAELLRSRARRTRPAPAPGGPEGPTVRTSLSALSPQASLNFGHRDGWSYVSGGLGWASLRSQIEVTTTRSADAESVRSKTINYGGGARWFVREHLAVSLDLRFYAVSPRAGTATQPGYPRMTVMVFSGGIAFR